MVDWADLVQIVVRLGLALVAYYVSRTQRNYILAVYATFQIPGIIYLAARFGGPEFDVVEALLLQSIAPMQTLAAGVMIIFLLDGKLNQWIDRAVMATCSHKKTSPGS